MKWLLRFFERTRPRFREGGKFSRLRPLLDAIENFFFSSSLRAETAPYVRDPLDLKRFMFTVVIALLPCVFAAVYFFGLRVLVMILVSYAVGGAIEVTFAIVRKEEINEGFLVTGLLFPLVLPPALPLWMVAVGVAFGVIVGKELFGGTGRNLFNPALVGRCFLAIGYPVAISSNWIQPGGGFVGRLTEYVDVSHLDAISSATPLVDAKQGIFGDVSDLFWGNISGSVGETSAFAVLLGGVFLILTRVANWRTVLGTLGSFALLGGVLHHVAPDTFGPAGWHLLAGGLLFGAVFMTTDPVTSPVTNGGKWAYAVIIGAATVLIRNLTPYVEGVMFAILLGNIAAPVLDEFAVRSRLRRLRNER